MGLFPSFSPNVNQATMILLAARMGVPIGHVVSTVVMMAYQRLRLSSGFDGHILDNVLETIAK